MYNKQLITSCLLCIFLFSKRVICSVLHLGTFYLFVLQIHPSSCRALFSVFSTYLQMFHTFYTPQIKIYFNTIIPQNYAMTTIIKNKFNKVVDNII